MTSVNFLDCELCCMTDKAEGSGGSEDLRQRLLTAAIDPLKEPETPLDLRKVGFQHLDGGNLAVAEQGGKRGGGFETKGQIGHVWLSVFGCRQSVFQARSARREGSAQAYCFRRDSV